MSARKVETAKDGTHADGGNLWLIVDGRSRRWAIRFTSPVTGRRREMGIGTVRDLTLAQAREEASAARRLLRSGVDPIEARQDQRASQAKRRGLAFRDVAARYIEDQTPGWRDPRLPAIWTSSLTRLAFPVIGDLTVDVISTEHILGILRPHWSVINETADRVRGRIERILDYARSQGWREGENPARWKGHLALVLPRPSNVVTVQHRAALPWRDIDGVMAALAKAVGTGAKAVRFAALTAARSNEVRGATWQEIDLKEKMWTVPAARMKSKRGHRVPLSGPAIAALLELEALAESPRELVFPGGRRGRPLSDVALSKALHVAAGTKEVTVHGLRSTFRDWVAEATEHPGEIAEQALAHVIGNEVERAYRRGDMLERRRRLMEDWGAFATKAAARCL